MESIRLSDSSFERKKESTIYAILTFAFLSLG